MPSTPLPIRVMDGPMCLPQDAQKLCPTIFPGTGSYISVTKFPSETLLSLQVCHICPFLLPSISGPAATPSPHSLYASGESPGGALRAILKPLPPWVQEPSCDLISRQRSDNRNRFTNGHVTQNMPTRLKARFAGDSWGEKNFLRATGIDVLSSCGCYKVQLLA